MSKECLNRLEVYTKMTDLSIPNPPKSEFELATKQECGQVFGADTDYLGITSDIKPGESVYECLPSERIVKPGTAYKIRSGATSEQLFFSQRLSQEFLRFGYGLDSNQPNVFHDILIPTENVMIGLGNDSKLGSIVITNLNTVYGDPIFKRIGFSFYYDSQVTLELEITNIIYLTVSGSVAPKYKHYLGELGNKLTSKYLYMWVAAFPDDASSTPDVFLLQFPAFLF